jgi:hypothetical protein
MARFHKRHRITPLTRAAAIGVSGLGLASSIALASQGQDGASTFTQAAMAILVYGTSALVVGAGLIGALRQR